MPSPLTSLMVRSKTTAAAATTATSTATATTAAMMVSISAGATATSTTAPLVPGLDVAMSSSFADLLLHKHDNEKEREPLPAPSLRNVPVSSLGAAIEMHDEKMISFSSSESSPPSRPADLPDVKYRFSAIPLLQDSSFYSNVRPTAESEGTSLNELAHLVRLGKYQERKRVQMRLRLQLNLISTALSARLVRCGEMAHRNLAECFRSDKKASFANLYNAIHDVRNSCEQFRKYALFEPELDALRKPPSTENLDTTSSGSLHTGFPAASLSVTPFLNEISAEARDTFMSFLTSLRNNPDYLATRLCSLGPVELSALTSFSQGMEPIDSVLPFYSRQPSARGSTPGRVPSHSSSMAGGPGRDASHVQKLLSFQRHDPLAALIHTCFANSAGPDSAEDQRRTDIWASACARLISEKGAAGEPVLIAVINTWSTMRDWSGRSNMEWFLMKILEDGAFLLDRAEDQNGTRFNLNEWTSKDQIAAEEFYDRAINDLFDVIDDEDMTGIPEGLIELGNQILKKLDAKFVENTRNWLVYKWLFGSWLLSVVIHPETHGLMAEYHITEYGRQKILKEVALRAQRFVVERTMSLSHTKNAKPVSTPPAIKVHIENILNRFRHSKKQRLTARLLPARSITSLRETVEVHPYLVVSPADLVTMVNALFPERRPRSPHSGSFRSNPGSVSNFSLVSQPIATSSQRSNTDAYSVLSTSVSSGNSDATTSVEPLLESQQTGTSSFRSSTPPPSLTGAEQRRANGYEDDSYRLRRAIEAMARSLGEDCVLGAGHPCAERWAVLFISADGNSLSTQMTYDPEEDDLDDDALSSSNDTDEESEDQQSDLEKAELDTDYHQLRNSILKLVEDFEIPQTLETEDGMTPTFSNRATRIRKYRLKNNRVATAESSPSSPQSPSRLRSRNPYLRHTEDSPRHVHEEQPSSESLQKQEDKHQDEIASRSEADGSGSVLIAMLTAASSQSRAQSDFLSAHFYWKTIQQLNSLNSDSLRQNGFAALLDIFSRGPRDSIRRSAAAVEEYDAWLIWLKQSQERAEGIIETMLRRLRALRDKMWFVSDVRHSGPYEDARNTAVALKTMGTSRKWNAYQRSRQNKPRGPAASYLYRSESETVELLAAPESHGGPNKLSDDQAEKTLRWLQHGRIANFCQGEERIHRFSCEIDICIESLIGNSIIDAPVLWSSDLYTRDRRQFEKTSRPGRDRDGSLAPWDNASISSFDSGRFGGPTRPPFPTHSDLRTKLGQKNGSVQSFQSSRYSYSKTSTSFSEGFDARDFLSGSLLSPVPAIDPTTTFWSPFHASISPSTATSRAQSPSASATNLSGSFSVIDKPSHYSLYGRHGNDSRSTSSHPLGSRPGTSATSVDALFQQRIAENKSVFLNDLRQTLTSLLLSDLGNLVFARGSETDSWFSSLGQECIERHDALEKKQRQEAVAEKKRKSHRNSLKQIVVDMNEMKGDSGELRAAALGGGDIGIDHNPSAAGVRSQTPETTSSSHGNDSSATASDHTVTGKRHGPYSPKSSSGMSGLGLERPDTAEFPFTKAYQRLLRMFCVHPNPYAKMAALFELENLITASLSSRSTRRRLALLTRSSGSPLISQAGAIVPSAEESVIGASASRARPLEEAIDNVKGRRSSTFSSAFPPTTPQQGGFGSPVEPRHGSGQGASPTKDAVACILQSLFCDPTIRPKTLFRDLQFIASFVPSDVLDRTDCGKSFWAAGLAALLLKKEVCTTMIELADEIVHVYTKTRKVPASSHSAAAGGGSSASAAAAAGFAPVPPPSSADKLPEAARMLTITAKEGHATSQRELALFYLSSPELVERTTLPLSKPKDVFKKALMEKYGGGSSGSSGWYASGGSGMSSAGVYDVRKDPALMCVAIHWMEAAEQGGDEPARTFLGQNEVMKPSK